MEKVSHSQPKFRKQERDCYKKDQSEKKHYKGHTKEGFLKSSDWKKNKMKHEYLKLLRKERRHNNIKSKPRTSMDVSDSDEETEAVSDIKHRKRMKNSTTDLNEKKRHIFSEAQKKFKEQKESSKKEKQEHDLKREEQSRALKKYQKNKKKKQMMLNKKTRKGQPIMRYQMNYLLQKIQAQVGRS